MNSIKNVDSQKDKKSSASKKSDTRVRLLNLLNIMLELSDEENMLSTKDHIKPKLAERGIFAKESTIIEDLKVLNRNGYPISLWEENRKGYYLENRPFSMAELRILIDAVQSSKVIACKRSEELIGKLKKLTSARNAHRLTQHVYVKDRIKTENDEVLTSIGNIILAIDKNMKITFNYYDYDLKKNLKARGDGRSYVVSPYELVWEDDYYYLVCNTDPHSNFSHYRVDKIKNLSILTTEKRTAIKDISDYKNGLNIADYVNKTFYMFGGSKEKIELKFSKSCLNSVIDRFGTQARIISIDEEYFKVYFESFLSPGLLFWILQFADGCEVLSPQSLRAEVIEMIENMGKIYE